MDATAEFNDLVRRHIGWVLGVARRRLGDAHLAEDVAQAVFILLHRKQPAFESERSLVAWLHRTAWYASEVAARQRRRRIKHETEAAVQRTRSTDVETTTKEWAELAPLLDRMIDRLGREEREAILLRFYRQMTFAEVASAMGSTEEAVRKRVTRALEKLRANAAAKGITMATAALAAGLDVEAASASVAPAGLSAVTTGAALAAEGSALATACIPIAQGATTMMMIAKLKIAASVVLVVTIAGVGAAALSAASAPSTRRVTTTNAVKEYPKLAPYAAIRFDGDKPLVRLKAGDEEWLELFAINHIQAETLVTFTKKIFDDKWQKRIAEDLVEVLSKMGHEPGETVKLSLGKLEGGMFEVEAKMTEENRRRIWDARRAEEP